MGTGEIRYARNGDVHIAYNVFGEGPDLIIAPGFISHLEVLWEEPSAAAILERLGSFRRVIGFDKRGVGLSDPTDHPPTLEECIEDLDAVRRAAGADVVDLFGISEGGAIPDATLVELDGDDHLFFTGDTEELLDEIEEFLTGSRSSVVPDRVLSTLLFTDVVGSTEQAVQLGDARWSELLDAHHRLVRRLIDRHRGIEVKTMGDGFLATFDGPARAIRCATAIRDGVRGLGLTVRAGLHTGEVQRAGDDISGVAVHLASRVCGLAGAGEVLVSRTVVDLVTGSGIDFVDHGVHSLKGVPGEWQLYLVKV